VAHAFRQRPSHRWLPAHHDVGTQAIDDLIHVLGNGVPRGSACHQGIGQAVT
jgi:hypothetical protein